MKNLYLPILLAFLFCGSHSFSQTYLAQVRLPGNKLWGYINQKGEIVIKPKFEKCFAFSPDGLAMVLERDQKQYYFIKSSGDKLSAEISAFKVQDLFGNNLQGFNEGLIPISTGEKWGYLNKNGKIAIPEKYDEATEFNDGYSIVRKDQNYFVLDAQGRETPVLETGILDIKAFTERLAPFKNTEKKTGFIDTEGKISIPAIYEEVGPFCNGLAWAKDTDALYGFINNKGEWVIKPKFKRARNFDAESGLALVKQEENWTYVNNAGELVPITDSEFMGNFHEGLADGMKGNKKGFYNNKGLWVIEPQFEKVHGFKNGYASVLRDYKWGVIDKQGNWVIEPKFDFIKDMELVK